MNFLSLKLKTEIKLKKKMKLLFFSLIFFKFSGWLTGFSLAYVNSIKKTDMTTITAKNINACHNSILKDPNGRFQSKASKLSLEGINIPAWARPNDGKYVV